MMEEVKKQVWKKNILGDEKNYYFHVKKVFYSRDI